MLSRFLLVSLSVSGILTALSGVALAAPVLMVGESFVSGIAPGETFTLSFQVFNPDPLGVVSYDFFVRASRSEIFVITAQVLEFPLDEPVVAEHYPYEVGMVGGSNFGAVSFGSGFSTGLSPAQTLTVTVKASAPAGMQQLSFGWDLPLGGGPNLVDDNLNEFAMSEPLVVTVQIVPEPGTPALIGLALVAWAGALSGLGKKPVAGRRISFAP